MKALLYRAAVLTSLLGCATGGGGGSVKGNEKGSPPLNEKEAVEYRKAVLRCYKSGGTRIVKVMGELKCY